MVGICEYGNEPTDDVKGGGGIFLDMIGNYQPFRITLN
jgi:hypothetical protein